MNPQRQPSRKSAAASEGGIDRDDVEHILGTFEEDGTVTPVGQKASIMDIYDRMRLGNYQSPIDPAPGFEPGE